MDRLCWIQSGVVVPPDVPGVHYNQKPCPICKGTGKLPEPVSAALYLKHPDLETDCLHTYQAIEFNVEVDHLWDKYGY